MSAANEMFSAIKRGDAERVRALLDQDQQCAGATDKQGLPAVLVALYHRQEECARVLADTLGDDIDLPVAAALGNERKTTALLAEGSNARVRTPDGFTPLHLAAFFGHTDTARVLLEHGADANAIADNPSRVRPLHSAAAATNAATIRLLLEHGAEVGATQHGGWTALQAVTKRGARDCIEMLLAAEADPRKAANDGTTAQDLGEGRSTDS